MHKSFHGDKQIPAVAGRALDVLSFSVTLRALGTKNTSHVRGFNFGFAGPSPVHQIIAECFVHSSSTFLSKRFEQQVHHCVEDAIDPKCMHVVMHEHFSNINNVVKLPVQEEHVLVVCDASDLL